MRKRYVGDGIYAEVIGNEFIVTTEDGISTTNRIVFNPGLFKVLQHVYEVLMKTPREKTFVGADIREATHVETEDGGIEKIKEKHGIGWNGQVAPPSKGGFSVTTENNRVVTMWQAKKYLKEE
jgi:hypothetical protein